MKSDNALDQLRIEAEIIRQNQDAQREKDAQQRRAEEAMRHGEGESS